MNSPLTEMAKGYFRSRVFCAAARLGLADALAEGERDVEQLAIACGAAPASLYRLLRALASFGIVTESQPMRFVLTPLGEPLRKPDVANSEWASVILWGDLLADSWSYVAECVRTGDPAMRVRPAGVPSRWSQDAEAPAIFRAVMGTGPVEDYLPIARAFDFSPYKTVADLGGGGGALLAAILDAFPGVIGLLVDRQESIDRAKPRFAGNERCKLVAADLSLAIPSGADVYLLKHVLHGYDDEAAAAILRNCRSVLPAEGRLLVIEFVPPDVVDRADFELEYRLMSDLNMLAVTGGKERSAREWETLLNKAGFECFGVIPVPGDSVSIIEALSVVP